MNFIYFCYNRLNISTGFFLLPIGRGLTWCISNNWWNRGLAKIRMKSFLTPSRNEAERGFRDRQRCNEDIAQLRTLYITMSVSTVWPYLTYTNLFNVMAMKNWRVQLLPDLTLNSMTQATWRQEQEEIQPAAWTLSELTKLQVKEVSVKNSHSPYLISNGVMCQVLQVVGLWVTSLMLVIRNM